MTAEIKRLDTDSTPASNPGVAHALRRLADDVANDELGDIQTLVITLDSDTRSGIQVLGPNNDALRVTGLLYEQAIKEALR